MKTIHLDNVRTALANATAGTLFSTDLTVKTIYIPVTKGYDPDAALFFLWELGEDVLGEAVIKDEHHKIILAA
jgi:hypothetical protein